MMDAAAWSAIVGPITTLLSGLGGYWLAGRNDGARDRRAAAREAVERRAALAERLEEQRHTFQRDTLLELQDELQRFARVSVRISLQDEQTLKERGQLYQLPPGLSDEEMQIVTSVRRLMTRVLDPELRRAVEDFVGTRGNYLHAAKDLPMNDALALLHKEQARLDDQYQAVNALLGEHLRHELDRRYLADGPEVGQLPGDRNEAT